MHCMLEDNAGGFQLQTFVACISSALRSEIKKPQLTCEAVSTRVQFVPDELIVVKEGCVFDLTEALFHSVNEGLDLQVGHLIQREEADASKYVQEVAGLQVESLQILR